MSEETVSIAQRPERARPAVFVLLGETAFTVDLPDQGALRIGRGEECELRVDHRSVSRLHAQITAGDPAMIEDLGSRNGTIVRGLRLEAPMPLHLGDVVECGEAMLVLRARGDAKPGSALRVGEGSRWFEIGGARANLGRRGALRRMFAHLVERRLAEPGAGVAVAELLEAGWPGEKMLWEAGVARVYTTVQRLRALGLSAALITRDDGYLIDPSLAIERE